MWKSRYHCFIIKNRYIYTKDKDLANVYSLVKKVSVCTDANGSFSATLKEIINNMEVFAQQRRIWNTDAYIELHQTITQGYDSYIHSKKRLEIVRNILTHNIYKFQELEEIADRISLPLKTGNVREGHYWQKSSREIKIMATHVTRDMSIANSYDKNYYLNIDSFDKTNEKIILDPLDGECVTLVSVTEDYAILQWGNKDYIVRYGTQVYTDETCIKNPYLSSDMLQLTFTYRETPGYTKLWNMIARLGCDELEKKEEKIEITRRKKEILHYIDISIMEGNTGLYVARALLNIYNNWGTCEISDIKCFQQNLLKGIDKGCLAPDNQIGWEWMEVASKYNDSSVFMEDMDLYYEVLNSAASHGVVEAIDIMNSIWEPEQIIEED